MSRIPKGTHRAKALSHVLGRSKNKGTEQSSVECELTGEGFAGMRITYIGYHTDATWERTTEALRAFGWTGDDISVDPLPGLGTTEVELVIDDEEYNGKTFSRVQFVNKPGSMVVGTPMNGDDKKAFAARMQQRMAAQRASAGKPVTGSPAAATSDDNIPF